MNAYLNFCWSPHSPQKTDPKRLFHLVVQFKECRCIQAATTIHDPITTSCIHTDKPASHSVTLSISWLFSMPLSLIDHENTQRMNGIQRGVWKNRKLKTEMDTEMDGGHGNGRRKRKYPSNYHIVQCCAPVSICPWSAYDVREVTRQVVCDGWVESSCQDVK